MPPEEPEKIKVPITTILQIRLKCVEIVFTTGSQADRLDLDNTAEKLYNFVMSSKIVTKA